MVNNMDDMVIRQKYSVLRTQLIDIKNDLLDLEDYCNTSEAAIKSCLLINNDIYFRDKFQSIKEVPNNVVLELTNSIIPNVTNKI